jgi:ATP-dependent exoDNAse (exonuclease V) beta subunit
VTPLDRIARFERDLVVQAGAGTGKTHALVTLYLHLVGGLTAARRRVPPTRIVVVTFTEKAAGELRERLRARLGALALDPTAEATLVDAARALELPLPDAGAWRDALSLLGAAPVGTFHAFAGALLRRHAARAGIDPEFLLLDEAEATVRAADAAERAILAGLGRPEVAELVTEYGYRGVGRGRALVDYLVGLRAALAEEGRGADGLARAYAPAALDEERARAGAAFSAAVAQLSDVADELGGKSAARAREMAAQASLLHLDESAPLAEALIDGLGRLRGKAGGPLNDVKGAIKEAHQRLVEAQAALRASPLARALESLLAETERGYAAAKRRTGALDFADLLVLARDLLRDDATVRRAVQERFDAVLVDEFQDTNPVQAELVELMSGPPRAAARRFVVGDRKQSIYEFRGADVAVFARAARALVAAGGGEELLRQSRRSAPSVLRLCNALFARAMAPSGAAAPAWDNAFEPMRDDLEPLRDEPAGDTGAELLLVGGGEAAASRAREARAIACRMASLRAAGRPFGHMALLLRRFTALGVYLDALRAAQVPYYVVRGRGFYAAQEVRDLAAALTLLDDPDDVLALVAVLRSPIVGLSDETLARLALDRRLRAGAVLDEDTSAALAADERARLDAFRARFRELRAVADRLGPAGCLRAIIDGADLAAVLASTRDGEQRVANLERLVERARAFEAGGGDLRAFSRLLARVVAGGEGDAAQAQVVDERDDVVRVMTIHQAKGLEFSVVFVPGCGEKERVDTGAIVYDCELGVGLRVEDERSPGERVHTTPSRRVQESREARQRAESLRLFYVAATRACDLVVFSGERGRASAPSWRTWLDGVADDLFTRALLRIVDGDALALPPVAAAPEPPPALPDAEARQRLARLVERPTARPRALTAAVTQLADFALCPRRYHYQHALGLLEHPAAARAPSPGDLEDDPTLDPLRRGTLAHRLLERCDFARGGADLDELLAADGYRPTEPAVAEVRAHVARFLGSEFARGLAGAAVRRELPFLLAVPMPEGALYVRGQIDLLLLDAGGVTVLDYKHARAADAPAYQRQLDAYALAARRLYPSAPSVRTGLVFLKEADPTPHLVDGADAESCAAELGALGATLARARAAGDWEGRPVEHCRRIQCGYVYRCHGEPR